VSGSFDKIDYSMRPAKYAERRMLRDVFRRVAPFGPPEHYTYIGFGSVWFSDFVLFHRALGVQEMISIESKKKAFQRVQDNAPFRIDIRLGRSEIILPKLDFAKRSFVWLDYDGALDKNMLLDLRTVSSKVKSGSLLAVTVRAERAREVDQANDDSDDTGRPAVDRFRLTFDRARIPPGIDDYDLSGPSFAKLSRTILSNEIESALIARNRRTTDDWRFEPICSFEYADGVLMTTIVGMYFEEADRPTFERCDFGSLQFVTGSDEPFEIDVPLITPREYRMLEAQMPLGSPPMYLGVGSIPPNEATNFERLYRYLPNYAVLEN
jgi:hypothetical protein